MTHHIAESTLGFGTSLWALIEQRVALSPDDPMLADEGGRALTFSGYRNAAEEVAAGLADVGVEPGHVVSWQLPTSIEAAVLMAALARLGVAQNPIVPILRRAEVGHIVGQLDSAWFIVPGTRRGFDYAAMGAEVIGDRACRLLVTDDFAHTERGISLPHGDASRLPPPTDPGDAVRWYLYSSGTTASPKGAKHTDRSAMGSSETMMAAGCFRADDVYPLAFPISHIGGVMLLTGFLRVGGQITMIEAFDPVQSPLAMSEQGVTLLGSAVPFFHAYLAAQRSRGDTPLFPKLRAFVAGGAPIPPELALELHELFGVDVINAWGLTEFPAATSLAIGDPIEKCLSGSVGRAGPGVTVRVVGADGDEQPPGAEGELRLRGPQCLTGYVDGALDAQAFDEKGYLRTGDLGTVDHEGYVRVTGRLKDVIIRNAENISALEIENVLYEHPAVSDAAVIGLPDVRTGERCCAVIVLASDAGDVTLQDLVTHCAERGLARQKAPEQLEIVHDMPRNAMGKILKHELRARILAST